MEEEKMENSAKFHLGSKITADGDCSYEIIIHLLLGRKAMTKVDSALRAETSVCQQKFI